ncbi:Uncharacterised protein [Mycobacterium tuberculosis]|nr:Uncharacterised protein [Mycobacterium tuberculosis]
MATTGVLGFILTLALPTAWPLPCGWLVTSASTLSNGRVERLFTVTTTWTECRPFVALELSCRICWASGDGDPGLGELAVVGFFPHPATTVAKSVAAIRIATAPRLEGRRGGWEPHACEIKPFMFSLCYPTDGIEQLGATPSRTACTEPRIQPRPWLRVSVTAYPHPGSPAATPSSLACRRAHSMFPRSHSPESATVTRDRCAGKRSHNQ